MKYALGKEILQKTVKSTLLGAQRTNRSTLLEDLQTYNEVCTQLRDLYKDH